MLASVCTCMYSLITALLCKTGGFLSGGANALLPTVSDIDVRMPGTAISGLIKAGTYLTENKNTEFWFSKDGNPAQIITIELQDHKFNRIVLQSEKNTQWIERIGEIISSKK